MSEILTFSVTEAFINKIKQDCFNLLAIDNGKINPLYYKNKYIVLTEVFCEKDTIKINGYTATPFHIYNNSIKALNKHSHQLELITGKRMDTYLGLKIIINHKEFVMDKPLIQFICESTKIKETQLDFFP